VAIAPRGLKGPFDKKMLTWSHATTPAPIKKNGLVTDSDTSQEQGESQFNVLAVKSKNGVWYGAKRKQVGETGGFPREVKHCDLR